MGVCNVNIIDKGIEYQYSFFVETDNEPAFLVILDWKITAPQH